jgi:hypothetical protein
MKDILTITTSKASSCDRDEDTTYGACVDVQVGPFVFAFWVTSRPFWRRFFGA